MWWRPASELHWWVGMVILGGGAIALPAQSAFRLTTMGQAIGLSDYVNVTPDGGSLSEVHLVQPVLTSLADLFDARLHVTATINCEGLTMKHGQLSVVVGKGFVSYDRASCSVGFALDDAMRDHRMGR